MDSVRAGISWSRVLLRSRSAPGRQAVGSGSPKHICLLAWSFPPTVWGGTYRPASIARYAAADGLKVTVFAGPTPETASSAGSYLADTIPNSVSVHRVPRSSLRPFRRVKDRVDGGFLNVLETVDAADRVLARDRPDYVLASGPPFHNFMAARLLARRFEARLVLDYRDEWTECPFEFVSKSGIDRRWERQCLKAANLVIFTTESQRSHQLRTFAELSAGECRVVPNGWEPHDHDHDEDGRGPQGDPSKPEIVLSFVGNLASHTLPGPFLRSLSGALRSSAELRENGLVIRFVGLRSQEATEELSDFPHQELVERIDMVPRPEAHKLMRDTSGLLVLNPPPFQRYLPGKLYDYLAAGPPVLVFGEGGEIASLVQSLNAGIVVPASDHRALAEALLRLRAFIPSDEDRSRKRNWLQRHTRRAMADEFVDLLRDV